MFPLTRASHFGYIFLTHSQMEGAKMAIRTLPVAKVVGGHESPNDFHQRVLNQIQTQMRPMAVNHVRRAFVYPGIARSNQPQLKS